MKRYLLNSCLPGILMSIFVIQCGGKFALDQSDLYSGVTNPLKPTASKTKSCTVQGYYTDHARFKRIKVPGAKSTKTATAKGKQIGPQWYSAEMLACRKACDAAIEAVCAKPDVESISVVGGCNEAYAHNGYSDCGF